MKYKRIDTHFRPEDDELYQYVMSQVSGWGDASQVVRQAIECYRLCRQAWGENWRKEIEALIEIARAM